MGQTGVTVFEEKRYPASQRLIVLQFGSPEEADAWEKAGSPITLAWPPVRSASAATEDEQNEGDDRQDDQNGPKHVATVPAARPGQADPYEVPPKRRGKPRL